MHKINLDPSLIAQAENDAVRLKWRRGLTDVTCRALASDFLRGSQDESTLDAYLEYQVRWGNESHVYPKKKKRSKKTDKSRYA